MAPRAKAVTASCSSASVAGAEVTRYAGGSFDGIVRVITQNVTRLAFEKAANSFERIEPHSLDLTLLRHRFACRAEHIAG